MTRMTNAEWVLQQGNKFSEIDVCNSSSECEYMICLHFSKTKSVVIENVRAFNKVDALEKWLDSEHKEKILTKEEHDYLAAVIKPFRDKVKWISKKVNDSYSRIFYIDIHLKNDDGCELPEFSIQDNLYNGMETSKKYTLEDLDL